MSKSTPILFQWEASDNPNDPEGVATYKCNGVSVTVVLDDFAIASKLAHLVDTAYHLGRNDAIDRAIFSTSQLLNEQRYD